MCNLSFYCKRNFPASVELFGDNKNAYFFAVGLNSFFTGQAKVKN